MREAVNEGDNMSKKITGTEGKTASTHLIHLLDY